MARDFDPTKTKQYAERETRRMEAYQAWLGGLNYREIAEKFGYSDKVSAMRAVKLARASFLEDAAEARDQATERIMGPLMAMRAQALPGKVWDPETGEEIERPGDPQAANAYKGLEERLSKLHGLDAPVRTDVTSDGAGLVIQVNPDRLTDQAREELGGVVPTWEYPFNPYGKQRTALISDVDELLFGGSIGSGKSELLLAACVDLCTLVPNAKALLVRRSFPELQELRKRLRDRIPETVARENKSDNIFTFFNGAQLILRYLDNEDDATRLQGFELQLAAFDELTHYDQGSYSLVLSRLRATGQVKADMDRFGFKLRALSASNPGGKGHSWVKERFVDPAPGGTPFTGDDGTRRLFLPSSLYDNPYIDHDDYVRRLGALDPERKRALIEGDWGVASGVRFPQFRPAVHTIAPEELPLPVVGAARVCGVDFGFNDPYAAVWLAKVHGIVVVYREDQATELTDEQQARRVLELSDDADLVHGDPLVVPLDEAAWRRNPQHVGKVRDNQAPLGSMAAAYMGVLDGNGAKVVKATHGPGSRAHRWATLDRMLAVNETTGLPGILIYDNCRELIKAIQSAPRDKRKPDDVDTRWPHDHILDALSYGYMELLGREYTPRVGGHERAVLEAARGTVTGDLGSAGF